jgi:hypothetical protein
MAVRTTIGGGNLLAIFPFTGSTMDTTPSFIFNKVKKSDIKNHPKVKGVVISIDNLINNEALETHLKDKLSNRPVTTIEETYEDGTVETFLGGDTTKKVGIVWFGAKIDDSTGDREVLVARGFYTGDTGSKSTEPNKPGGVKVELTTSQESAAFNVPQACLTITCADAGLTSALTSSPGALTIAADSYGLYAWVTSA